MKSATQKKAEPCKCPNADDATHRQAHKKEKNTKQRLQECKGGRRIRRSMKNESKKKTQSPKKKYNKDSGWQARPKQYSHEWNRTRTGEDYMQIPNQQW
jgi:hypothetical protein